MMTVARKLQLTHLGIIWESKANFEKFFNGHLGENEKEKLGSLIPK